MTNPIFDFIAGYSLSLHGIFLDSVFGGKYEKEGIRLIKSCLELSKDISLGNSTIICKELFNSDSILDKYFLEIYAK